MSDIKEFLKVVDEVTDYIKPIYKMDCQPSSALYFIVDKYKISRKDIEILKSELLKRDCSIPSISMYNNEVYGVTISRPWIVKDDQIIRIKTNEQCMVFEIERPKQQ